MKKVVKLIDKVAKTSSSFSWIGMYQPKTPEGLKSLKVIL